MKKFLNLTTAVAFGMLLNSSFSQASSLSPDITESREFHKMARQLIVGVVDTTLSIDDEWDYQPISLADLNEDVTKEIKGAFEKSLHDRAKVTFILRALRHCMLEGTYAQDASDKSFKMTPQASDFHKFISQQLPLVFKGEEDLLGQWHAAVQRSFSKLPWIAGLGETQEKILEAEILKKFQPASPTATDGFWSYMTDAQTFIDDNDTPMPTTKKQTSASASTSSTGGATFLVGLDEAGFQTRLKTEVYPLRATLKPTDIKNGIIYPISHTLSKADMEKQKVEQDQFEVTQGLYLNSAAIHNKDVIYDASHPVAPTLRLGENRFPNLQALVFVQGVYKCSGKETLQEIYDGNPNLKYLTLMNLEEAYWKKLTEEADKKSDLIEKGFFCESKKSLSLTFKTRS